MSTQSLQIVKFNPQAYVVIEGQEELKEFYIIQSGQVRTYKSTPVYGDDKPSVLGPGDFFGVESAMSGHKPIEVAQALTPVSAIKVRSDQFGLLIQKSAPLAMKIIRSFSMKLRAFDTAITRLSFRNALDEDPSHLFELGESWFKKSRIDHAAYAFQRYLQYCPKGEHISQTKMYLQKMNRPLQAPPAADKTMNRVYTKDRIVFCENEPGYELYIIQSGSVMITKLVNGQEVMLAVLNVGDIFGEMAILDNKPRSATAVVAEETKMMAINKDNFEALVKSNPNIAVKLITLLSERIWTAYRQLANLTIDDPVGRLYDMLLIQVEKNKIPVKAKATHDFNIGAGDLLKMVGFDPQNDQQYVASIINKHRWLKLDQGTIRCYDLLELERQVDFYRKAVLRKRQKAAAMTI
ncbi:MAG: cyclic nucleotide-binding domain-containing protein [Leptonema sp. (in: Bacteria)]|nr:cyclic nucleotide-binding domain-containing protein [Leptonema sp. (in: bacteria)]